MTVGIRQSLTCTAAAVLTAVVAAQNTIQVDRLNSPGTDFTSIEPAIAAAQSGDTIIVLAGTYSVSSLDIDKGVALIGIQQPTILALPTLGRALTIHDLSVSETFTMRGFGISGTLLTTNILIENCAGKVFLRDTLVTGSTGSWFVSDSPQVILENCQTHRGAPGLRVTNSSVVANSCTFRSTSGFGMTVDNSNVDLVESNVFGGGILLGSPGLFIVSGTVRVSGGVIQAGNGLAATPTSAVQSTTGTILLDPTVTLSPTGGAVPIGGPASVINTDFPTAIAVQTAIDVTIIGEGTPGDNYASILTLPPLGRIASPFGDFWIDPGVHVVLGSGVFPAMREASVSLNTTAALVGFSMLAQVVQIGSGTLALSNPALMIFD